MKQIQIIIAAGLIGCSSAQAAHKVQYKLPVVGQLTPEKVIGIAAASAATYCAARFLYRCYLSHQFENAIRTASHDQIKELAVRYRFLLYEDLFVSKVPALYLAVYKHKTDVVQLLLDLGAPLLCNRQELEKIARNRGYQDILAVFAAHVKKLEEKEAAEKSAS